MGSLYVNSLHPDSSLSSSSDRDSPNSLPLFDILQLGAWTDLLGDKGIIQERHYQVLQWLIEKGLNTEGIDVAGFVPLPSLSLSNPDRYTALQHSLSGNPLTFDFRWSTILLNASECQLSAINHRNRFGATSLHEAVMSMHREGENEIKLEIIEFLLEHGANGDSESSCSMMRELIGGTVPDNDGCNARSTAAKSSPAFNILFDEAERLIIDSGACQFCHRGGIKGKGKGRVGEREEGEIRANLRCSACRSVTCECSFLQRGKRY